MIVASHQPNFMPYPGYFFKMYCADVFTISDTVKFSSTGFHNYNYLLDNGRKVKITVPVKSHDLPINEVMLSDWRHYREKILKRVWQCYHNAPHFRRVYDLLVYVFRQDFLFMEYLNTELILVIRNWLRLDANIVFESSLDLRGGSPTDQIVEICSKLGADTYLSGEGAKEYLDERIIEQSGFSVAWSGYESIDNGQNLSMIHYLMHNGFTIPDQWKRRKEEIVRGTRI